MEQAADDKVHLGTLLVPVAGSVGGWAEGFNDSTFTHHETCMFLRADIDGVGMHAFMGLGFG